MSDMRDIDIRAALARSLRQDHEDSVENRIWSEFAVCLGASRVDVCLINGALSGYEIKSPRDNLGRLAGQVQFYGQVLDYAHIVTADKHLERMLTQIPEWWGAIRAVDFGDAQVGLEVLRVASKNPKPDPLSVAQLLWREEALTELRCLGFDSGLSRGTRWAVWDRMVEVLDVVALGETVRRVLKARPVRAADGILGPDGAMSL